MRRGEPGGDVDARRVDLDGGWVVEGDRRFTLPGLGLEEASSSSRYWRRWVQRLVIRSRRRELGLGGFPLVPLKEARAQALANRRLARAGRDPLAEKRRLRSMPTFAAAAEPVLAQMRPGCRNPKHGKDWLSSMERFAFPRLGCPFPR